MRKLAPLILLALLILTPAAADARAKKLPHGQARLEATFEMESWALTRGLSYPAVKCQRKSRVRFRCTGVSTANLERVKRRCNMVAVVTNQFRRLNYGGYWEAVARLTKKACRDTAKPFLDETDAKAAILEYGKSQYGDTFIVGYLYRMGNTEFWGRVGWHVGPNLWTGQDCDADVKVWLSGTSPLVAVSNQYCFTNSPF